MAIGLLGLVVLSVSGLFLGGQASMVHSLEGSRGSQVAEAEMAYLKGLPWATLSGYVTTPPAPKLVRSDEVDVTVEVSAERLDPSPGAPDYDLVRLHVTTTWQENRNLEMGEKRVSLGRTDSKAYLQSVVGPEARF
jgi:hypothetical protein